MSTTTSNLTIAERPEWSVTTTQESSTDWLRTIRHTDDVLYYHYGPKEITFDSPMVNATNLICNGAFVVRDRSELIIDQLARQRKPFGETAFIAKDPAQWNQTEAEARKHRDRLRDAGLVTQLTITTMEEFGYSFTDSRMYLPGEALYLDCRVIAARNIAVGEIGSLAQLQSDYEAAGLEGVVDPSCANLRLSDFVNGRFAWDFQTTYKNTPEGGGPWLTGLVLGYPVWSTISLYRGGVSNPEDDEE